MVPPPLPGEPLSVAQAINLFNALLGDLRLVVEGEVANYGVSQGKFVFFDLKDETEDSRLSCFMMLFKQNVPLEDGMRVRLTCKPNVHSKSGKFSLTVERIEPKGEGSLKRAFELLKQKLEVEGLFAEARKRALPRYPARVGIISSESAAGYGDFMRIAGQRLPGVTFTLANVAVQGSEAEGDISFALDYLNSHHELDVIVLIRGGGSMEDLHAFNSESVARAIVRSRAPVLVGVGHERDVTIADFCADVRAATPTNAAQLLLPTAEELLDVVRQRVQTGHQLLSLALQRLADRSAGIVERLHQMLVSRIQSLSQHVEQLGRTISAVSPQNTLKRGYSITWKADGTLLRRSTDAVKGETIRTQLATDSLTSIIQ